MRLAGAFILASLLALVTEALAASYLVYPAPTNSTPTKVQLIFGLGIPMEVEVSTIVGYVMKCNYNLPYNASYLSEAEQLRYRRSTDAKQTRLVDEITPQKSRAESRSDSLIERYEIYKMLETTVDSHLNSGKACLLRAICELAATPLNLNDGSLTAQLLNIFLKPSSTAERSSDPRDQEYLAAEVMGRERGEECARSFSECSSNILEYFSVVSI